MKFLKKISIKSSASFHFLFTSSGKLKRLRSIDKDKCVEIRKVHHLELWFFVKRHIFWPEYELFICV